MPEEDKKPGGVSLLVKAGGAASAIVAILGLVFVLRPDLKPKEPEPPPAELVAEIGRPEVEAGVPYSDWGRRIVRRSARNCVPGEKFDLTRTQDVGNLVHTPVEIRGYKGKYLCLRWSMYDAKTNAGVQELGFDDALGTQINVGSQRSKFDIPVPVYSPTRGGRFFVRLSLIDSGGSRLDSARTPAFRIAPGSSIADHPELFPDS